MVQSKLVVLIGLMLIGALAGPGYGQEAPATFPPPVAVKVGADHHGLLLLGDGLVIAPFDAVRPYLPQSVQLPTGDTLWASAPDLPLPGLVVTRPMQWEDVTPSLLTGIDPGWSEAQRDARLRLNLRTIAEARPEDTLTSRLVLSPSGQMAWRVSSRILDRPRLKGTIYWPGQGTIEGRHLAVIQLGAEPGPAGQPAPAPLSPIAETGQPSAFLVAGSPHALPHLLPSRADELALDLAPFREEGLRAGMAIRERWDPADPEVARLQLALTCLPDQQARRWARARLARKKDLEQRLLGMLPAQDRSWWRAMEASYQASAPLTRAEVAYRQLAAYTRLVRRLSVIKAFRQARAKGTFDEAAWIRFLDAQPAWAMKPVESELMAFFLERYLATLPAGRLPDRLRDEIRLAGKDYGLLVERLFAGSVLTRAEGLRKLRSLAPGEALEQLTRDYLYLIWDQLHDRHLQEVVAPLEKIRLRLRPLHRTYQRQMQAFFPDQMIYSTGQPRPGVLTYPILEEGTDGWVLDANAAQALGLTGAPVFTPRGEWAGILIGGPSNPICQPTTGAEWAPRLVLRSSVLLQLLRASPWRELVSAAP